MHVPDHYLDPQTTVVTAAVAIAGLTIAARRARDETSPAGAVMPAMVATFIFASQMLNFTVGSGTSGHLLGGALAAVLVGPATATLCLAGVLAIQALFFADGGVTAWGTNVTLMALVGVIVGWLVFRGVTAVLPQRAASVPVAAAVGALISVPVAALAFTGLFAIGGQVPISVGDVAVAMVGWHALIGLGEAAITLVTVGAVVWLRPDLVFGLRVLRPQARRVSVAR